jgi:hypothetical protein
MLKIFRLDDGGKQQGGFHALGAGDGSTEEE